MNAPERPLAEVGPVVLRDNLKNQMRLLGRPETDIVRDAQRNVVAAAEQGVEKTYWDAVAYRSMLIDLQPPQGRAIHEGTLRLRAGETAGIATRSVAEQRSEHAKRVLEGMHSFERRAIAQAMARTVAREGITLRLLPADVVASYNEYTREMLLETLRDSPRDAAVKYFGGRAIKTSTTGFANNIEVTPTEQCDGVVLSAVVPHHRVFLPQRWNEVTGLLPAVGAVFNRENKQLLKSDHVAAMDSTVEFLDQSMKGLQQAWAHAPTADTPPTWFERFLHARGWANLPLPRETKSEVVERTREFFTRVAGDWVQLFHKGIDRERLTRFLR